MKPRYFFGNLDGPAGNAYAVMGFFSRALSLYGSTSEEIQEVMADCMSGDYEHLLDVVEEHVAATVLFVPEEAPEEPEIISLSVWRAVRRIEV